MVVRLLDRIAAYSRLLGQPSRPNTRLAAVGFLAGTATILVGNGAGMLVAGALPGQGGGAMVLRPPPVEATCACLVEVLRHNFGAVIVLILGALTFGALSAVLLLKVGASFAMAVHAGSQANAPWAFVAFATLTHGVVELAAFGVASSSVALLVRSGFAFLGWQREIAQGALRDAGVAAGLAALLLLIGGLVECAVTPRILNAIWAASER